MLMVEWVGAGYIGADTTSGGEYPVKFATDGLCNRNKIFEYAIGDGFVKRTYISKSLKVKF